MTLGIEDIVYVLRRPWREPAATGRNMAICLRAAQGDTQRAIAADFGISPQRVDQIVRQWRRWWRSR